MTALACLDWVNMFMDQCMTHRNTVESYSEEIWTEYMKLAAVAAEEGWHIHEHTMADRNSR